MRGDGGDAHDLETDASSERGAGGPTFAAETPAPGTRDPVDYYLDSIRHIPLLSQAEVARFARVREREERRFANALYGIPATASIVLCEWRDRRRSGRVTGLLGAHHREPGTGDTQRIDSALLAVERHWLRHEALRRDGSAARESRAALEAQIAKQLARAELALSTLMRAHLFLRCAQHKSGMRQKLGFDTRSDTRLARARRALVAREAAIGEIVRHNLKLVVKFAKRYRRFGVGFSDLIQEGNLGLIRGAEKFDPERGNRFSTYAVWWIEQGLIRSIQNQSRTVRLPSHVYDRQVRYRRAEQALQRRLGRDPVCGELAEALGMSTDAVEELGVTLRPAVSLHATLPDGNAAYEGLLRDEHPVDPLGDLDRMQLRRELVRVMRGLRPRERQVLSWRFGLEDDAPVTLEEIGRRIGLSRERVRQIESRALRCLRERPDVARLVPPSRSSD